MFFSIILPVYNGERFLSQSIESVLSQSFHDYEFIIVNDGSIDSTLKICRHYESLDLRIRIIDTKNEGVAIARNKGLDVAKGEYVLFIDADDILFANALSVLHGKLCETSLDYLRYEYQTIDEYGNTLYPNYKAKARAKYRNRILKATDCIQYLVRNEFFLWSGVFKRGLIEQCNLRFLGGCTYCEDMLFMMQFFMKSTKHLYLPKVLYGYRKSDIAVTSHFTEKNLMDVKSVIDCLMDIASSHDGKQWYVLKMTIEKFTFSILTPSNTQLLTNEITFCTDSPILYKWRLVRYLGINKGLKLSHVVEFLNKIIRKICWEIHQD